MPSAEPTPALLLRELQASRRPTPGRRTHRIPVRQDASPLAIHPGSGRPITGADGYERPIRRSPRQQRRRLRSSRAMPRLRSMPPHTNPKIGLAWPVSTAAIAVATTIRAERPHQQRTATRQPTPALLESIIRNDRAQVPAHPPSSVFPSHDPPRCGREPNLVPLIGVRHHGVRAAPRNPQAHRTLSAPPSTGLLPGRGRGLSAFRHRRPVETRTPLSLAWRMRFRSAARTRTACFTKVDLDEVR